MLQTLFLTFVTVSVAVAGGTASVWYALENGAGFDGIRSGPWTAYPAEGRPSADPYLAARRARNASLPLGQGEGLAFRARTDSDGRSLEGRCAYHVEGNVPTARLWTLHAEETETGRRLKDAGLHSRQILRRTDGSFIIGIARTPMPGNWIGVESAGPFSIVLTLFDSPVTGTISAADQSYPRIDRIACD